MSHLRGALQTFIDWSTVPYCSDQNLDFRKFSLKKGEIVIIRMADPGKVGIIEKDIAAVFASYLVRLTIKESAHITPYFLFYTLNSPRYQNFISGASSKSTRKSASAKLLVDFKVLVPPKSILDLFDELVIPIRNQINILLDQNAKLRTARDLLLPPLVKGEIVA